jgi:hypothetical protein
MFFMRGKTCFCNIPGIFLSGCHHVVGAVNNIKNTTWGQWESWQGCLLLVSSQVAPSPEDAHTIGLNIGKKHSMVPFWYAANLASKRSTAWYLVWGSFLWFVVLALARILKSASFTIEKVRQSAAIQ